MCTGLMWTVLDCTVQLLNVIFQPQIETDIINTPPTLFFEKCPRNQPPDVAVSSDGSDSIVHQLALKVADIVHTVVV